MAVSTTVQIRAEDKTKQAFRNVTERTQRLKSSFAGLTTAVAGAVEAIGIGGLMSSLKDLGDRIGKGLNPDCYFFGQSSKTPVCSRAVGAHHRHLKYSNAEVCNQHW